MSSTTTDADTPPEAPADALPLPQTSEVRLLSPEILLFRGVIPWGDRVIALAEELKVWNKSSQIKPYGGKRFESNFRSSSSQMMSKHVNEAWAPYEEGFVNGLGSAVSYYKLQYNPFLSVQRDSGYELLRYQPGEKFDTHIDNIAGQAEGSRQLTAVIYLNDDYTGGELAFPRQSLKVKAKAGDIVLFPSNFCYPHTSLPIISGTKYAVVTWFS